VSCYYQKVINNNWSWFLDLLYQYAIDNHTRLCIILVRHATIKNFMEHIFPESRISLILFMILYE
jgi:hypothetical protein